MFVWKNDGWSTHVNTTFVNLLCMCKHTQFSTNMCARSGRKSLSCVLQVHVVYIAETICLLTSVVLPCLHNDRKRDFRKCVPNYSFQKQKDLWRPHFPSVTQNILLYMVQVQSACKRAYYVQLLWTVTDRSVTFRSFEICNYNRNN